MDTDISGLSNAFMLERLLASEVYFWLLVISKHIGMIEEGLNILEVSMIHFDTK